MNKLFTFFAVLLIAGNTFAQQENKTVLSSEIETAKRYNVAFTPTELFSITTGNTHDVLADETLLNLNKAQAAALYEHRAQAIALSVSDKNGKEYVLEMLQFNPLAANAKMRYTDKSGSYEFAYDKGLHYQGALKGDEHSLATMSIFANGKVMILFANADGNFVIGELEGQPGSYIFYNDADFLDKPDMPCATTSEGISIDVNEPADKTTAKTYECKKISVYFEVDYQFYQANNNSISNTQTFITGMFAQIQTLYRNEQIAIELKSMNIWTTDDGYPDANSHSALSAFRSYWGSQPQKFDADIAVLIAKDNGGNGGVAYLGGMCTSSNPYAYGDISGTYMTVPSYSWDVSMTTHEIGHLIGSPHTHWCGWNTGIGGSCGAIDDCYNNDRGSGCNTCSSTFSNSAPNSSWQGTIMSYCHLQSRGVSLANGFGPIPGDYIRDRVNTRPCLKSIISAQLTATPVCNDYGQIKLDFDTATIGTRNFGTPIYNYQWSAGNVTTKDITVVKAGDYNVTVTDGNGCSETFTVNVPQDSSPDCFTTGINEITRSHISAYPNPADERVTLKFFSNAAETTLIKVTDITGSTVLSQANITVAGENDVVLNTQALSPGMYFITLLSANNSFTSLKVVIQ